MLFRSYVHAGDVEKPVQQEKYRFLDALSKKFKTAQQTGDLFLACGDLNVAHKEADLKNHICLNQNNKRIIALQTWKNNIVVYPATM